MKMRLETREQYAYRNIDAGQCPGCPSNLATKLTMQIVFEVARELGQDPIVFGQGCGIGRDLFQRSGIGTHDSACVGLRIALEMRGIDRPVVVIDGDGQIDMGFDDFTGAFQLGYPYMHVVCDNQAYAASGTHATGMTDLLARVSTRPDGRVGKPGGHLVVRKQPAMMIKFSGARYAATASPSHLPDFEKKVRAGLQQMPAFLQIFTPCNIAWGFDDDQAARVTRLGVTSGIWPLWEWGDAGFRRTIPLRRESVRANLDEYVHAQRRYSHLKAEGLAVMERYVLELNDLVDRMARAFAAA
jgi:pyruvate/2-oxoacid:ferredoxin oxidoreductase beta subunit